MQRRKSTVDALLSLLVILAVWEAAVRLGVLRSTFLPSPSRLVATTADLIGTQVLFINAAGSLLRVLAGFSIASVLGVGLGLVLSNWPAASRRVRPFFELLRPIPPIAWIPIAILWFGLGNPSAIFIVTIGAFFPIFFNTYSGINAVSQAYVNAARSLGAGRPLVVTDILLPAALPQILTGLRVGVGIAWTSVIAAEMVGAREGLGYAIQLNRTMLETDAVIVNMIVIGLLGWAMNFSAGKLEHRLTPWNTRTVADHHSEPKALHGR